MNSSNAKRAALACVVGSFAVGSLVAIAVAAAPPTAVPTFESVGLYWSPPAGAENVECAVRFRSVGGSWRDGLPLWFDDRDGEYRGSLVHLRPGTTYDIELTLVGQGVDETLRTTTWSEVFPIAQVVTLPALSTQTLVIDQSGSAAGYVLYAPAAGSQAVIDGQGILENAVEIRASYVILRGVTIRDPERNGVRIYRNTDDSAAHDVVIEDCDVSGWGRIDPIDGFGVNGDAAVYFNNTVAAQRLIIQRNVLHDPRADTNNWLEERPQFEGSSPFHPRGPMAVYFLHSAGNHVIRYNEIMADVNHHYMNDGLSGGSNFSEVGFPNRDSDIYGNLIRHVWDDAIEAEGANCNVRIWGNYTNEVYVHIAAAATSLGPLYVWRNVGAHSRESVLQSWDDDPRGCLLKTGRKVGPPTYGDGRIYVFHNTIVQPPPTAGLIWPLGAGTGIGCGGTMTNTVSRNNVLQVHRSTRRSVYDRADDPASSFDYDLYNGVIESALVHEVNGVQGTPVFRAGAYPTVDAATGTGDFALDPSSPGLDTGEVLHNFNDGFAGTAPDVGAQESDSSPMVFGQQWYLFSSSFETGGLTEWSSHVP